MLNTSEIVGNRLKELNVKKKDLAESAGVSVQYIGDLINGKKRWNESLINKAFEALGIEIEIKKKEVESCKKKT